MTIEEQQKSFWATLDTLNLLLRDTERGDVISAEERALAGQIADVMIKIQDLES